MTNCVVCETPDATPFRAVDQVQFFECRSCGTLFADPAFLSDVERGTIENYQHGYWEQELHAARDRSYGASLQRLAETIIFCRLPVRHFVDIGAGPGYLLDAAATALPAASDMFYGVELYPPEPSVRSKHQNYTIGSLGTVGKRFEAGVCIEVIEHLTPSMLDALARELASVSVPGSLYLFNSGQPEFVKVEDPGYLDPRGRGHIMSYSVKAASSIFGQYGFTTIPFPGRRWAFLVEYQARGGQQLTRETLEKRLWAPLAENVAVLTQGSLGSLLHCAGRDGARCSLEHATVVERTAWAQSLASDALRALPSLPTRGALGLIRAAAADGPRRLAQRIIRRLAR